MKDFQLLSKLGEGAYSVVHKVKRRSDGLEYALKRVRMSGLSMKEKENALNEVRILASIKYRFSLYRSHPNIIAYKEAFIDQSSSSLCIVMEYAEKGDLLAKIQEHTRRKTLFREDELWTMLVQMVSGLKALHDRKILHRDIKAPKTLLILQCANVFITKDNKVKLGDLNVSKVAKKGMLYTQTGTPYYASPEIWKDKPYDAKSDMWSLGCVLYEAAALQPPFRATNMQELFKKVVAGVYPELPRNYSADLSSIIKMLLQQNPSNRPTCSTTDQTPLIEQLLEQPSLAKTLHTSELNVDEALSNGEILGTILFPKNLSALSSRLPKPNYKPCPQLQKYECMSSSLQPRAKSITGRGTSSEVLEPIDEATHKAGEERKNAERHLKPRCMRQVERVTVQD